MRVGYRLYSLSRMLDGNNSDADADAPTFVRFLQSVHLDWGSVTIWSEKSDNNTLLISLKGKITLVLFF